MSTGLWTAIIAVLTTVTVIARWSRRRNVPRHKSVAIVVLGDIGRSPRMLYHATSFLRHDFQTTIIAYRGSKPPSALLKSPKCRFVYLPTPLAFASNLPRPLFLLLAPLKVLLGAFNLLWTLIWTTEHCPEYILVQNPPSIPTLPIVQSSSLIRPSKLIIDWHNTGHSVLALRLGPGHPVVRVAKWIENTFGRNAFAHLCVTRAMKQSLEHEASLRGRTRVLYDRPPAHFRRLEPTEAHQFFSRMDLFSTDDELRRFATAASGDTLFTSSVDQAYRRDRPALLVSATSWTADEDFTLLLDALDLYDKAANACETGRGGLPGMRAADTLLPRIVVVITGKGAGKAAFGVEVSRRELTWTWVKVRTAWLAIEDYPKLLGTADLGISLHTSTSGADLPMKVVDMFGCGLPVCALDFACISELVKNGTNGRMFRSSHDLANLFMELLRGFNSTSDVPSSATKTKSLIRAPTHALERLRDGIRSAKYGSGGGERDERWRDLQWCDWDTNWDRVVWQDVLAEMTSEKQEE